jgi:hypothetical protein
MLQTTELKEYGTTKAERDTFPPMVCVYLDFMRSDWFALQNVETGKYWKSNIRSVRDGKKCYVPGGWAKLPANCCTVTNRRPP